MSRSYRLFDLMQVLRRHRTPVSAAAHRYIAGSCELRDDFRLFCIDRIGSVRISVFKAWVEIHTDGRTNRSA
uniref:Uncharacterized protein n=1 Tax=Ralstonia syzygii R24 TaxID=907261 RepID=G3A0P3_9RALS|nr:hypothetical protein RALSY_10736 [Ralstonia syzygii R24]